MHQWYDTGETMSSQGQLPSQSIGLDNPPRICEGLVLYWVLQNMQIVVLWYHPVQDHCLLWQLSSNARTSASGSISTMQLLGRNSPMTVQKELFYMGFIEFIRPNSTVLLTDTY